MDAFLTARLDSLTPPDQWPQMPEAAQLLASELLAGKKLAVWGDYDVDGVTAATLVLDVLESHGIIAQWHIPDRRSEGYGLNVQHIEELAAEGCGILLTVDCGISDVEAVRRARELGMTVVVSDHHLPPAELPPANAICNPKVCAAEDLPYPHLAGVGVAFYLMGAVNAALAPHTGKRHNMGDSLDLVALGTLADVMPLTGENRVLVRGGLVRIARALRPGMAALKVASGMSATAALSAGQAVFRLAPRINAAGRLGNAISALQLLTASKIVDAYHYADMLEGFNQKRQTKEQEIFNEAKHYVESAPNFSSSYSIIAAGDGWHQGVIGIVASRFARDYNRPAIVLTIQGDEAHGSGRSIGGLNLIKVLSKCSHLQTRYGGHPMAVGLGLRKEDIPEFSRVFEETVRSEITPEDLIDSVSYDGTVNLSDLGPDFFSYYDKLGPFGHGNPQPCYRLNRVEVIRTFPIKAGHTKGILRDSGGDTTDFIAFNMLLDPHTTWDVVAVPQINEYYGERRRQLQLVDARPCSD